MDHQTWKFPIVTSKRKREPQVRDDEKHEVLHRPKRLKIGMRTVFERLAAKRIDPSSLTTFDTSILKDGGSAHVVRYTMLTVDKSGPLQNTSTSFRAVAVKKFKLSDSDVDRKVQSAAFANELILLSEIQHDNIVEMLGFVENSEEKLAWIVFPWEGNGNIREFVQSANWVIPERLSL
ncbi:hypothetical protein FRB90_005338, partial [Tulasnella sp. 427]